MVNLCLESCLSLMTFEEDHLGWGLYTRHLKEKGQKTESKKDTLGLVVVEFLLLETRS